MTTIAMVKCGAGCGTSIRPGEGRYCTRCERECADLAAELEARWQKQRRRHPGYGLTDAGRLDAEGLAAMAAGNAERRSTLMAQLPRVDAGVAPCDELRDRFFGGSPELAAVSRRTDRKRWIDALSMLIGVALAGVIAWLALAT